MFLRSGYSHKISDDLFCSSSWARNLIKQISNSVQSDISKYNNIDNRKILFYKDIDNQLSSSNYQDLDKKFDIYIQQNDSNSSLPFEYVPIELVIAKKLHLKETIINNSIFKDESLLPICNENNLSTNQIDKEIIDELLRNYIFLDESVYAAVSGDGSPSIMQEICSKLEHLSDIVCIRTMHVTEAGKRQWVRLQYAHESHWDERRMNVYMNHPYHGIRIPGSSIGVIFFQKKNADINIRDLKKNLRESLVSPDKEMNIFPHVHIADTHLEAKWIANSILNKNSRDWINKSCEVYPKNFSIIIQEYQKEMSLRNDGENYCLDTGSVMSLHGIRDTSDIDYISIGRSEKPIVNGTMEQHSEQYKGYHHSINELVENPIYHFYYKNIKTLTISQVLDFKKYREKKYKQAPSSKKDRNDIKMIENYLVKIEKIMSSKENKGIKSQSSSGQLSKPLLIIKKTYLLLVYFPNQIVKIFKKILRKILPSRFISILELILEYYRNITVKKRFTRLKKKIPNTLG